VCLYNAVNLIHIIRNEKAQFVWDQVRKSSVDYLVHKYISHIVSCCRVSLNPKVDKVFAFVGKAGDFVVKIEKEKC